LAIPQLDHDPRRGVAVHAPARAADSAPRILRFLKSERLLHWTLAIPFVLLYGSALMMLALWGEPHPRHIRTAFAWVHRTAGACLVLFPPIALLRGRKEWRIHLENMREGWIWTADDLRWLILFPKAAADSRITLPEQGKFNAAEKLNFMMVFATYPLYIATGLMIWLPGIAFVPWLAHCAMAVIGFPLVAGHIFMATINPGTRIGLSGMITGRVDREWAKHHYRRWFREKFERFEPARKVPAVVPLLQRPATLRCGTCHEPHAFESWERLLERMFQVEPLFCPSCGSEMGIISAQADPVMAEAILRHLENGRADEPFGEQLTRAA
jgi:formate dehydrogenase subunit gamma